MKRPEKQTDLTVGQWVVYKSYYFCAAPIKSATKKQIRVASLWNGKIREGSYSVLRFHEIYGVFDNQWQAMEAAEKANKHEAAVREREVDPLLKSLTEIRSRMKSEIEDLMS